MPEAVLHRSSRKLELLRDIAGWILCVLLALAFFMAGLVKVVGRPDMVSEFEVIGLGQWFRYLTGLLEMTGAIGLLIPRFSRMAALGLAIVMAGAIIAHLTVLHSPPTLPAVLFALLLVTAWIRR